MGNNRLPIISMSPQVALNMSLKYIIIMMINICKVGDSIRVSMVGEDRRSTGPWHLPHLMQTCNKWELCQLAPPSPTHRVGGK